MPYFSFRRGAFEIQIHDAIRAAAGASIRKNTNSYFVAMNSVLSKKIGGRQDMQKANTEIATKMRVAIVDSYQNRVTARERFTPYRIGQNRFSGGALGRALGSPSMAVARADGIDFVDDALLDSQAAHWYRLNFGAGAKATQLYTGRPVRVKLGRNLGSIRMNDPPSAPFSMPFGLWERGQTGRSPGFYPLRRALVVPTEGIAGRRFLDAGLHAFAREFPPAYEALVEKWVTEAHNAAKGPLAGSSALNRF